ncbi:hypothetical protein SprV_0602202400 [Sparganum proliferum]
MQPIPLGQQVTDVCVVAIEPVLVLATCAAEDSQGGRVNGVPLLAPLNLHGGVFICCWEFYQQLGQLIAEIQTTELHLGGNEAVVRPAISVADCLGHHHALLISLPNENIVKHLPTSRLGVHPGGLLRHRQAEGVGQQEAVFSVGSQENETVVITGDDSVRTQHPPLDSAVRPDVGIEVTKANLPVRLRHKRQEGVQVFVELGLCLV